MSLVARHIAALTPYPPGKPIEELEREMGISGSIKLASNENPLGPSAKAVEAIRAHLSNLHRYPDGSAWYLRGRLAERLGVEPANIVFGNGSNEVIDLVIRTFLQPGQEAVVPEPTFLMYDKFLAAAGCRCHKVALLPELRLDLDGMLEAGNGTARLFIINNPNNPTGTVVGRAAFDRFLAGLPEEAIVLLDEAYIDFAAEADTPRGLDYLGHAPQRVIALRTFSKMYGLAGLRIGYGVMPAELASYLERVRQPFNVNSLAQVAALAALDDHDHYRRTLELTAQGLKFLQEGFMRLGFECVPTHANFFLAKVGDGQAIYERMLREGVIIRSMKPYGLPEYIRISAGLPEENERCVRTLAKVLGKSA
ncbi:MAG: histidinol-phosphate transaminase [Pseudomonadota bacterium]